MKKCLCILLAATILFSISMPHKSKASTYTGQDIVTIAKKYLGVPYLYGGTTTSGFDCSGFTSYVYKEAGITIKRTAKEQYKEGTAVKQADLQPGDLVFFSGTSSSSSGISHVGIYTGDNSFISSTTSKGVSIASMNNTYWKPKYTGAKRIINSNSGSVSGKFTDVSYGHFAFSAIESLSSLEVIKGYSDNTFRPDQYVTRGQAAAMINRALKYTPSTKTTFIDVASTYAFANDIAAMKELGIINGYSDGTYRPNETLTRTQMAVIIANAFNLKAPASSTAAYNDVSTSYWAYDAIAAIKAFDLTGGFQTSAYNGNGIATRCYFAAAVYSAVNK